MLVIAGGGDLTGALSSYSSACHCQRLYLFLAAAVSRMVEILLLAYPGCHGISLSISFSLSVSVSLCLSL